MQFDLAGMLTAVQITWQVMHILGKLELSSDTRLHWWICRRRTDRLVVNLEARFRRSTFTQLFPFPIFVISMRLWRNGGVDCQETTAATVYRIVIHGPASCIHNTK